MTNVIVKVGIWELLYNVVDGVPVYNKFFSRLDNVGPVPRTLGHFSAQDHAGDTSPDGCWVDTIYLPVGGGLYKKIEVSINPVEMTGYAHEVRQWIPVDTSAAASVLGSIKTAKKAHSSAENGRKGGRPREWSRIEGMHFFSATEIGKIYSTARKTIIDQPGYKKGARMSVMKTVTGSYRLYVMPDGLNKWMDASLQDLPK